MNSFEIFGIIIHWYGVIISLAMLAGIFVASFNSKKRNLAADDILTCAILTIPFAIIGARALFVLCNLSLYSNFWEMIATWNGGMSIFGGVIGGLIGVLIFCKWKKKNLLFVADIIAPSLILGQAIGRWGNFVNQELYGAQITNSSLQWFPFAVNVNGAWYQALFFYESFLNLIGFATLMLILHKSSKKGIVTAVYFMFYGAVRFILEPMRESEFIMTLFNIPLSQALSALIFIIGLVLLIYILVRNAKFKKNNEAV